MSNNRSRLFSRFSVIASVIAAALTAGALVLLLKPSSPPLDIDDVEGVWRVEGDEKVQALIRADGTAELANVPDGCPSNGGGYYSGPARWAFDTVLDESPGVRFKYKVPNVTEECSIHFSVVEPGEAFFIEDRNPANYVRNSGGSE